jgi:hypothetical protein
MIRKGESSMKTQSLIIVGVMLALLVSSLACGPASFGIVRGSGRVDTETHALDNITGVELATFGDLTIAFGDKEELRIEAEDNLLPYFEITESGGQVQIDSRMDTALRPTKPVRFYLTVKALDTIVLSGSGNVNAPNLDAESIAVTISGSGDVDLGDLEATTITLRISGSGNLRAADCVATDVDVRIPGSGDVDFDGLKADTLDVSIPGSGQLDIADGDVTHQTIAINGSGDYRARNVESDVAEVEIFGSGSVTLWANESLDIRIAGSGDVTYAGRPTIDQTIVGSGSITRLGE